MAVRPRFLARRPVLHRAMHRRTIRHKTGTHGDSRALFACREWPPSAPASDAFVRSDVPYPRRRMTVASI